MKADQENSPGIKHAARSIVSNSAGLAAGQVVSQILALLINVVLARHYGTDGYGVLMFAFGFADLFSMPAAMGTNVILTRNLSVLQGRDAANFWESALRLRSFLFLGSMAAGLVAAYFGFHNNTSDFWVLVWALFGLVSSLRGAYATLFRARLLAGLCSLFVVIRGISYCVLALLVIRAGLGIVQVAQAGMAATLIALSLEVITSRRMIERGGRATGAQMIEILRQSWPVAISSALTIVQIRLDGLLLKLMTTNAEVGIYGAATKLSEAALILPSAVGAAAFPLLARAYDQDRTTLGRLFRNILQLFLILGIPFAAILAPLAKDVVVFLFHSEFTASGAPLSVLCAQIPLAFVNILMVNMLFIARRQKLEMMTSACTTAVNASLNLLLIPRLGAVGAACAALACQIVTTGVLVAILWRTLRLPVSVRRVAVPFFCGAISLCLILVLRPHAPWMLVGCAGVTVYLALLWVLTPGEEKQFVFNLFSRSAQK